MVTSTPPFGKLSFVADSHVLPPSRLICTFTSYTAVWLGTVPKSAAAPEDAKISFFKYSVNSAALPHPTFDSTSSGTLPSGMPSTASAVLRSGFLMLSPGMELPLSLAPTPAGAASVNSRSPCILMVPSAFLPPSPSRNIAFSTSVLTNQSRPASAPLLLNDFVPLK